MRVVDDNHKLALVNDQGMTLAQMVYEIIQNGDLWVTHTYTNPDYRGQGLAGQLFKILVDKARQRKVRIVSNCSYVSHRFNMHPDRYQDVIGED